MDSGEMLPAPVLAARMALPSKSGFVLPLASVARMVTATGSPAVIGPAIGSISKWCAPAGMTGMGAVVMPRMDPLVMSSIVRVWSPMVPNDRVAEA